ncbi:cold shock CspA family protein [Bradyrhizobium sp. LM6.10]
MRGSFPMAMTGTVKFFNGERGYGFIKPDDGGRDVFVHITAVERAGLKDLAEGQRITFEVEPDKKGKGAEGGRFSHPFLASPTRKHRRKKIPAASGREAVVRYFLLWVSEVIVHACAHNAGAIAV